MNRSRIFISAVSEELRTARQTVARTIQKLGFDPITQDDFPSGHGELRQWLRSQIDSCEGLIQLVGQAFGVEPPDIDAAYGRVSYTQFEFLYARDRKIKTWVVLVDDSFNCDISSSQLDLPRDFDPPDPIAHQSERRKLQKSYIDRLKKENHVRYTVKNIDALENFVLRLRDDLGELRQRAEQKQLYLIGGFIILFVLLGVALWWGYQSLRDEIVSVSEVNTAKIRSHLLQTIEETYRVELAQADAITDWKERQRLREGAKSARTARMSRLDEFVDSFTEIEGQGTSTTVSHELARVLAEAGVDQAIDYISTQRAAILGTVRGRSVVAHDRNRTELQPLLRAAALHKAKGQASEARALYDEILDIEPEWPQALHAIFWFLVNQGDIASGRTTLEDARHYYQEAHQRAQLLLKVDPQNGESQRDYAISLGKLGELAESQGRLEDAAKFYGDGAEKTKSLAEREPHTAQWQRDLLVSYTKMGQVALVQGKLQFAVQVYTDGLTIAKALSETDPKNMQRQRDLCVMYLKLGDAARAQGRLQESAQLYKDALTIAQRLVQIVPSNNEWQRDISVLHGKFGEIAETQGRLQEAAQAYKSRMGIVNALVAIDQGNLQWQQDLATCYAELASVSLAEGDLKHAVQGYTDHFKIIKNLTDSDPSNFSWQTQLAMAYSMLGELAEIQGMPEEAAREYEHGLSIAKTHADEDPSNAHWQRTIAVHYVKLGNLEKAKGNFQSVAKLHRDALLIARALATSNPKSTGAKHDLAMVFAEVGQLGNLASSKEAYTNSLKIAKDLVAIDFTNTQWQRDLAIATQGLGDVAMNQGSLQKAERIYSDSLEIRKRLATGNPNNIRGQHDLWSTYWRLALLAERQKNQHKAQAHWNEAFRVLSNIEKRGVYLSPEYRRKLETLRQKKDYGVLPRFHGQLS